MDIQRNLLQQSRKSWHTGLLSLFLVEKERKPSRGGFQALRGGFSFSLTLLDQGT
jgi:hypothetical protein